MQRGKIAASEAAQCEDLIRYADSLDALSDSEVVIEAVVDPDERRGGGGGSEGGDFGEVEPLQDIAQRRFDLPVVKLVEGAEDLTAGPNLDSGDGNRSDIHAKNAVSR